MKLQYIDENDKCYGITGMAIGMVIWDAENVLSSISVDAPADEVVEFTPDFYFSGNPGLSAKVAWNHIVQHFQVSMGMLIGNLLCRSYVLHKQQVDDATRNELLHYLDEEGKEVCSLESDEIERLFNKSYNYLYKVFNHTGVQSVAHDFARDLKAQRRMSRGVVIEHLRALRML